jgi:CubicO group peptidase (beta-lactamase class C family)
MAALTWELDATAHAAAGVDAEALRELLDAAQAAHTDVLWISRHGERIGHWGELDDPDAPVETMSVTKSIVSVAIGALLHERKLTSVDQPVAALLPEFDQPGKREITIRQLLAHTSGLEPEPTTAELYTRPDILAYALEAPLIGAPGEQFQYNNRAMALLAALIERAAGEPMDRYVARTLFAPLGIETFEWMHDEAGHPHAFAGLSLRAVDLGRIGELMVRGGEWDGRRIVDAAWIEASTRTPVPSFPRMSLSWWILPSWRLRSLDAALLDEWRAAGVDPGFIAAIAPLAGQRLSPEDFRAAIVSTLGEDGLERWQAQTWERGLLGCRDEVGPPAGFYAEGYLGQYLVVLPDAGLVAVRQVRERPPDPAVDFPEFPQLVAGLAR